MPNPFPGSPIGNKYTLFRGKEHWLLIEDDNEQTTVSLCDPNLNYFSCFLWDGDIIESMGISCRNLEDKGDLKIVYDALVSRYEDEGQEFYF